MHLSSEQLLRTSSPLLAPLLLAGAAHAQGSMTFITDRDVLMAEIAITGVPAFDDSNFGGCQDLSVGRASGAHRSILSFDVSALSGQYSSIDSVTLRLVSSFDASSTTTLTTQVYAVTAANQNWVEGVGNCNSNQDPGTTTWNEKQLGSTPWAGSGGLSTPGVDYDPTLLGSASFTSVPDNLPNSGDVIDIVFTGSSAELTALIDQWLVDNVDLARPNPGLLLFDPDGSLNPTGPIERTLYHSRETATPGFEPQLIVGYTPASSGRCDVLLADLTGDGELDAATVDVGTESVSLFVGDGLGAFDGGTATAMTPGDAPVAIAAGNLVAGDGTDIAVAAKNADAVRILSNAPEGTLTVASSVDVSSVGSKPIGVAAGDVDGSGLDDVAIALEGEVLIPNLSGVAVSLDGALPTPLTAPAGGYGVVGSVDLADLDGDGDLDAIATMTGNLFVPGVKSVMLWEGDGAGAFASPVVLTADEDPKATACHDVDGDGDLDLLVAISDLLTPGGVQIFLNDGLAAGTWSAGDYSAGGTYAGGDSPTDLAVADLDDDNIEGFYYRNDVVTTNLGSGDLTRQDGFVDAGSGFEGSSTLSASAVPFALAIGDLNGDKTPDVVVANKADADLTVILGDALAQARAFGAGCTGTGGLVPAIGATNLPSLGATDFSVDLSNGRAFSPAILTYSLALTPLNLGACDLYVDGTLRAGPFLTDGSGAFSLPLPIPNATAFFGCDLFFQWAVVDPNGALLNLFALSDGLRLKLAN